MYFSRGNLTLVTRLTLLLKTSVSPDKYQKIAPCKGIQDSLWIRLRGFLIPDSRYRIPASLSLEQSLVAFGILELYSGFQSLGFQIPQAKISQIPWTKTFKTVLRRISYGAGPLATSSLAVGRFAAKKGSLSSPRGRGRLIASLLWTKKTNKRSIAYVVDTLAILLLCK